MKKEWLYAAICHHHHVHEGLGVFPVPWSSKWSWSLQLFLGRPMFLRLLVYIVVLVLVFYSCPSSVRVVTTFSGTVLFPLLCSVLPFFPLIHWFLSLSNFVIPSKCLKDFICAASKRFPSFLQYPSFTSKFQCCFSCNVVKPLYVMYQNTAWWQRSIDIIVSGLRAGAPRNRGSIPGRDRGLLIVHSVQSGSENHPASYSMGTWGSRVKAAGV